MTDSHEPRTDLAADIRASQIYDAGDLDIEYRRGYQEGWASRDAEARSSHSDVSADLDTLRRDVLDAIVRLPEPTLGLRGGVNRGAVVDAINAVFRSAAPSAGAGIDVERLAPSYPGYAEMDEALTERIASALTGMVDPDTGLWYFGNEQPNIRLARELRSALAAQHIVVKWEATDGA